MAAVQRVAETAMARAPSGQPPALLQRRLAGVGWKSLAAEFRLPGRKAAIRRFRQELAGLLQR